MAGEANKKDVPKQDDPEKDQKDTPDTGDPPGENGDDKGDGDGKPEDKPAFTQAQVEAIVRDRLERERKKAEKEAQKAKDDAEAASLVEQKKFEDLANKHGKRLAEVEPQIEKLTEDNERMDKALQTHLAGQKEGLPDHILALLEKMDPVDQLEYIANNHAALFPDTPDDDKKKPGGVPPTPKQKGEGNPDEKERRAKSVSARNYF